jgi:HlyD family secretion protein
VVLLAGVLAACCPAWAQPKNKYQAGPSNPFVLGVGAQGRIVPAGGLVRVGVPGEPIVAKLLVKEGDWVEVGQLLAVLNDQPVLQAQLDAALRDKDSAATALAEAQAAQARAVAEVQAQITDLTGQADMADATAHRAAAESVHALDQAKQAAAAAHAAVDAAQLSQKAAQAVAADEVAAAQVQLDALPRIRSESDHKAATLQVDQAKAGQQRVEADSAAQIQQLQAAADAADLRVQQAQDALIQEPAPDDPAKLAPVQAEARAMHANLEATRNLLAAVQSERAADVAAAQARVASAAAAIATAQAQLALAEIHAPSPGKILAVFVHPGEVVGESGLLVMGDIRDIFVDALVYIDDISSVQLGEKVTVVGSALPIDGLSGEVVNISPMVAGNTLPSIDPTAFSDQSVVLVKVHLDNPGVAANLISEQVQVRFQP